MPLTPETKLIPHEILPATGVGGIPVV
jgi:hypothetical protein